MKTKQEIFDLVRESLEKQGKPSISPGGSCRYRTKDGLKCAAGFLIPDDGYLQSMEGKSVDAPEVVAGLDPSIPTDAETLNFLSLLQHVHDTCFAKGGIEEWRHSMQTVAKDYDLEYNA